MTVWKTTGEALSKTGSQKHKRGPLRHKAREKDTMRQEKGRGNSIIWVHVLINCSQKVTVMVMMTMTMTAMHFLSFAVDIFMQKAVINVTGLSV
jgi:hypothetical protein